MYVFSFKFCNIRSFGLSFAILYLLVSFIRVILFFCLGGRGAGGGRRRDRTWIHSEWLNTNDACGLPPILLLIYEIEFGEASNEF
jgi:hypothetical protein